MINSRHSISVVVPVFNESLFISSLLNQVEKLNFSEVIIVDGNSTDETQKLSEKSFTKLIVSDVTQRSYQCNLGAKASKGDYLLFLHADLILPNKFEEIIQNALSKKIELANFKIRFDNNHWFLRLNTYFSRFRSNNFQFGDQGLLIKRSLFEKIGGYNENIRLAEGNDIIRRARKISNFEKLNTTLIASARKYNKRGIYRLQLVYFLIYLMLRSGMNQAKIEKMFKLKVN